MSKHSMRTRSRKRKVQETSKNLEESSKNSDHVQNNEQASIKQPPTKKVRKSDATAPNYTNSSDGEGENDCLQLTDTKKDKDLFSILKGPGFSESEEQTADKTTNWRHDKDSLIKELQKALSIISPKVLASIEENDVIILGREKIEGTRKQLCHIIPVALIKNQVKQLIAESKNQEDMVKKLQPVLLMASKFMQGGAISEEDLNSAEYEGVPKTPIRKSTRVNSIDTPNNSKITYFFSPGALGNLGLTPVKIGKATKKFKAENTKYINKVYEKLVEQCEGEVNILNIFAELVTRYIIALSSKGENIVFAPEGNTIRYEIRLFDKEEYATAKPSYEILTAKELKQKLEHNEITKSEYIRIVDNEGAKVDQSINAINLLISIVKSDYVEGDYIDLYNKKLNQVIKLANSDEDIITYNSDLTEKNIHHHIAKTLYQMFDLKALEEYVLVPIPRKFQGSKIKVLPSATASETNDYMIDDGAEYREYSVNSAQGYPDNRFFRSKEKDLEILPKELAKLFIVGVNPFSSYYKHNSSVMKKALDSLIHLAATDYEMNESAENNLSQNVYTHFEDMVPENYLDIHLEELNSVEFEILYGQSEVAKALDFSTLDA